MIHVGATRMETFHTVVYEHTHPKTGKVTRRVSDFYTPADVEAMKTRPNNKVISVGPARQVETIDVGF